MTVAAVIGDTATTLTVALAATWPTWPTGPTGEAGEADRPLLGGPLVVEADPAGGSLAGWFDVPVQPSTATAAGAIARGEPPVEVIRSMARRTAAGLRVMTGPPRRAPARRAVAAFLDGALDVLVRSTDPVVVDLGADPDAARPVTRAADVIVVAHRQRGGTAAAEAVRIERLIETVGDSSAAARPGCPMVLAITGDVPFDPAEIARFVEEEVQATTADTPLTFHAVADDPLAAAVLCGRTGVSAKRLARLPLMRSASELARRLDALITEDGPSAPAADVRGNVRTSTDRQGAA